jgi:putative ABC transport system ATP-binding protein
MILKITDLRKSYRAGDEIVNVLRGVNIEIAACESMALTGESGSGKSTLLHLIAGLDKADGGDIWIGNSHVTAMSDSQLAKMRRTNVGLVFQQFNLIPSLNVADNLGFLAKIAGRFDGVWQAELVGRLGLDALLHRYPEQLSGGQQQRVAIGRALASRPKLVLADEPTGNLDEATADAVLHLTRDLVRRSGCSLLMATHSQHVADAMDRRLHLSNGLLA